MVVALLLSNIGAGAADFVWFNEGNYIYFQITDRTLMTLEVVRPNDNYSCSGSITIPAVLVTTDNHKYKVTSIGKDVFSGSTELTRVLIGNTVTNIASTAFYGCTKLDEVINISKLKFKAGSSDYGCIAKYATKVINAPNGEFVGDYIFYTSEGQNYLATYVGDDTELLLPESYKGKPYSIGDDAFKGYQGTILNALPDGVTSIGAGAFEGCVGLTTLSIPDGVISIEKGSFYGCSNLVNITLPNSITSIGMLAFEDCYSLTELILPNSITSIGTSAFYGCNQLKKIINFSNFRFKSGSSDYGDIARYATKVINAPNGEFVDDFIFYTSEGQNYLAGYVGDDAELLLPESYKGECYGIGDYAFKGYQGTIANALPDSVTSIGAGAFSGCVDLTTLSIPDGVKSIGQSSFYDCSNLNSIAIPNSVVSICDYAFYCCSNLTSLLVPYSITSIGSSAFSGCTKLKKIINFSELPLEAGSSDYGYIATRATKVINAPNGEFVDDYVFYTSEGQNYLAGYAGDSTSLFLPESYKGESYGIGDYAFKRYTTLKQITIPANITGIGKYSFWDCRSLSDFTSLILEDKLFVVGENTFRYVDRTNCVLHVPYKAKETYASTEGWTYFKNIKEIQEIYKATFIIDGEEVATIDIKEGDSIVYPEVLDKEGHTLIWDTMIDIMPSNDITINGQFCINSYALIYTVDTAVFAIDSLTYGSKIILRDDPVKDGYTFSGWGETPEFMPAHDVNVSGVFISNTYTVTFVIDGEVYKTIEVVCGAEIELPATPEKEGYTFAGWSNLPSTMPAEDIVVTGSYILNRYRLTYFIDDEEFYIDSLEYGSVITAVEPPVKEGHTFKEWVGLPQTMPAEDIDVFAKYSVNKYLLTFVVDGEIFYADSVVYGSQINVVDAPVKEGYSFSGWVNVPETMPAENIVIKGTFSINSYTITFMIDGEVYEVMELNYGAEIKLPDVPIKEGYVFGGWENAPTIMPAYDVVIEGHYVIDTAIGNINATNPRNIIYNLNGVRITDMNKLTRGMYIVNGQKVFIR